jgi:hypothetical protein
VKSKGSKPRSIKKKVVKKKAVKCAVTKCSSSHQLYICIHQIGRKYLVYPATERQYQKDLAAGCTDAWYFATEMSVVEFALAGVFGVYNSLEDAENAILAVDPGCDEIYKPPAPINPR